MRLIFNALRNHSNQNNWSTVSFHVIKVRDEWFKINHSDYANRFAEATPWGRKTARTMPVKRRFVA